LFPECFVDLSAADHEQVSSQRLIKRQHRINIAEHQQRLLRFNVSVATEHDVKSVLQRLADCEPRLPTHHHCVTRRRLTKKLHVRRIVPRQLPAFTYRAFPIDCCNADDHKYTISQPHTLSEKFIAKLF
jgi:hypothetical protein